MKKKLYSNRGITGIDLAVALIVIMAFTGVVANLMYLSYFNGLEILKAAEADSIATIILEKVDEKPYEEIEDDFVQDLIDNGEINISDKYVVNFETIEYDSQIAKRINLTVKYKSDNNETSTLLTIAKLKIKEIGE